MSSKHKLSPDVVTDIWYSYLMTGQVPSHMAVPWHAAKRLRPLFLHLPAEPRCSLCYYPFQGLGGRLVRSLFGVHPSELNPQVCNLCDKFIEDHPGGAEIELTILFADVRGSTQMAEEMSPTSFSALINRFYNTTTRVLYNHKAMVEKLSGDSVTAFFTPGFGGPNHASQAVAAGKEILLATGHSPHSQPWAPAGVGIHTGRAYVGAITGDGGVKAIAVLGDTANTGARLAALAGPGEILVSQAVAGQAELSAEGVEIRRLELKGRRELVDTWVLKADALGA